MVTTLIMVQSVSTMLVPSEVQYIGLKPWRIYAVLQSSKGVAIELHISTSIPLCMLYIPFPYIQLSSHKADLEKFNCSSHLLV